MKDTGLFCCNMWNSPVFLFGIYECHEWFKDAKFGI